MNDICVIIPMYGFSEITDRCVELTKKNAGIDVDILVVDDGSPSPYENEAVHVLRLKKNSGYTNATNQGILWCSDRYKYVHLLNNDTEPFPNFIYYLYEVAEKNPNFAVTASVRMSKGVTNENGVTTDRELYGADLIRGYQLFINKDVEDEFLPCIWVPVCSALIPVEALRYVGLLDKRMRNHCSDNDFCLRARILGYDIVVVPKSKVKHERETTIRHNKILPYDDQKLMIEKLSGLPYQRFMSELPLDCEQNKWGKVDFMTYTKNGKAHQPSTT